VQYTIYVDGSGPPKCKFGYIIKETGESVYKGRAGITNTEAEYLAVLKALKRFDNSDDDITLYSDSQVVVQQLNQESAINNDSLRDLARKAWKRMAHIPYLKIKWIPRNKNLAGKMLGS